MEIKKRKKDILFCRGVDAYLLIELKVMAEENGYTMAELINMALDKFLKEVRVK